MPFFSSVIEAARGRKLVTTNLQLYYDPKQSVSGTTYLDVAPDANDFDLSILSGVDTSNASNGYLRFDGVDDEIRSSTTQSSGYFDLGTYATFSGWYKPLSLFTSAARPLQTIKFTNYGSGDVYTHGLLFDFHVVYFSGVYYRRFIGYGYCNGGSNNTSAINFIIPASTIEWTSNEWYYVSIVKDDQDYYIRVIPKSTGIMYTATSSLPTGYFTEDGDTTDQRLMFVGATYGGSAAHMDMGELFYHEAALTQDEIYNNYLMTKDGYV